MIKILLLCASFLYAQNLIGNSEFLTSLKSINHLNSFEDNIVISANNGIYFLDPESKQQSYFNIKNGLNENVIHSTHTTSAGLFAIGMTGSINIWDQSKEGFKSIHTSFQSAGYTHSGKRAISVGNYLIIPFTQGLSLYDIKENRSYLTISRISDKYLLNSPIKDIGYKNDSLFVLIDNIIYSTPFNSENIELSRHSDDDKVNHVDPNQWDSIYTSPIQDPTFFSISDSLVFFKDNGDWASNQGKVTSFFQTGMDTLLINGKPIVDSIFYHTISVEVLEDVFEDQVAPKISNMVYHNGTWFFSTVNTLIEFDSPVVEHSLNFQFPDRIFTELNLFNNLILGWSYDQVYQFNADGSIQIIGEYNETPYGQQEILNKRLKIFETTTNGDIYIGGWGTGIKRVNLENSRLYHPALGDCLRGVFTGLEFYSVTSGITADDFGGVWFSNYTEDVNWKYSLGYIDSLGEMNCFYDIGAGKQSASIKINPKDSTELAVVHYEGIDFFDISTPTPQLTKSFDGKHVKDLYQVEWDGQDRLWAHSESRLVLQCPEQIIDGICFNFDFADSLLDVSLIFGLQSGGFSSLQADALGNLWIGTRLDGAYYIEASKDSISGNDISSFSINNGLFSKSIIDILVNNETGEVWFLHPDGITKYQSNARQTDEFSKSTLKVFPNPWRVNLHDHITFDQIPKDSEIHIFNESRTLIQLIKKEDIVGGHYLWDLKNHQSREIKGGVYTYVVKSKNQNIVGHLLIVK